MSTKYGRLLNLSISKDRLYTYSKDLVKLFALANIGMSQLYDWFTANKLSVNVDKTCYSVFGPNCKKTVTHTLQINGQVIQNVKCCKYLGILIDNGKIILTMFITN